MIYRCLLMLVLVSLATADVLGQQIPVEQVGPVDQPPQPNWVERLQRLLGDPNIVFLLLLLGIGGVVSEVTHPGTWYPGIAGVLCLIFAFFGGSVLPINYVGVALIALGVLLILLELKVHSAGVLTGLGLVSLVGGSAFLVDPSSGVERVSWVAVAPLTITVGLIMALLVRNVVRAHKTPVQTGMDKMVGALALVKGELRGEGFVFVSGELWRARCNQALEDGETVRVVSYEGLTLHVKPLP